MPFTMKKLLLFVAALANLGYRCAAEAHNNKYAVAEKSIGERIAAKTVTVLFSDVRSSLATGKSSKTDQLSSPDGDIFLRKGKQRAKYLLGPQTMHSRRACLHRRQNNE